MSIGDNPAFPVPLTGEPTGWTYLGMTYRHWLIGQALAGSMWMDRAGAPPEAIGVTAVTAADAVIKQLDEESGR